MRQKLFLIHLFSLISLVDASRAENQLYRDLQKEYSKLVRPVKNDSEAVRVEMKVFLQQIVSVDGKNQIIELNAWLKFVWIDYRLSWNPTKYENIKSVRFAGGENQIWRPDILLYNSANEDFDATFKSNEVVYNTGEVNWVPPGIFRASCKMDITYFPFDEQVCFLKFGSWTYNGNALDLQIHMPDDEPAEMDLSTYIPSGEWKLLSAPAIREVTWNTCCPEPYPTVTFYMHMKNFRRRAMFYLFNIVCPSLLISAMTLMGFCLPAHDMSEKISYQMTILLSICFFVTIVSEMTPPTSEAVPILGLFFSVLTLLVSVSTCFTVNVLNFRYRQPGNKHMSKTFYSIFLVWLPWFLLMRRPGVSYERKKERRLNEENEENETNDDAVDVNYPCCCTHDDSPVSIATTTSTSCNTHNSGTQPLLSRMYSMPAEHLNLSRKVGEGILPRQFSVFKRTQSQRIRRVSQFEKYIQKCKEIATDQTNFYYCEYAVAVIDYYTQIHKRMREIRRRLARKKIIAYQTEEWKFAAMALDRLCVVLFTIFFITCIFSISVATPNIDL